MREGIHLTENHVKLYHEILRLEAQKIARTTVELGELYELKNIGYCLSEKELIDTAKKLGLSPNTVRDLEKAGFIINVGSSCYRSFHFDLLLRSSDIRLYPEAPRMVLTTYFSLKIIPISSSKDRNILPNPRGRVIEKTLYNSIVKILGKETQLFIETLREYFKLRGSEGYDPYQALALIEAFENWAKKGVIIVAPTGAGKTEVFISIVLAELIRKIVSKKPRKILLIYPRKMLEVDQMHRLIQLLFALNKVLKKHNINERAKIYLRDGDTYRLYREFKSLKKGETIPFRGINCVKKGELYIKKISENRLEICCDNPDDVDYSFIIPFMSQKAKEADIIVTNMQTLLFRTITCNINDIDIRDLLNTSIIVLDEAHEYDSVQLALIRYLIKSLIELKNTFAGGDSTKIIVSSATLANPEDFIKDLLGLSSDEVLNLSFSAIKKKYEKLFRLRNTRAILTLFVQMHPYYSWITYLSEFASLLEFLHLAYRTNGHMFIPQAIIFINNIKELTRTRESIDNALSLGSPLDNLCVRRYSCKELSPIEHRFIYPHYLNISKTVKDIVNNEVKRNGNDASLINYLRSLYDTVFSEVPLHERSRIYKMMSSGDLALVLATSSLELGMDYPNVSIIVNAGFDKEDSMIQRIGRGGRSISTLNTVLSVIVARNNPLDYRMYADRSKLKTLANLSVESLPRKAIAYDLDAIRILSALRLALSMYSLKHCDSGAYLGTKIVGSREKLVEMLETVRDVILSKEFATLCRKIGLLGKTELNMLSKDLSTLISIYSEFTVYDSLEDLLSQLYVFSTYLGMLSNIEIFLEDLKEELVKGILGKCVSEKNRSSTLLKINRILENVEICRSVIRQLHECIDKLENSYITGDLEGIKNELEKLYKYLFTIDKTVNKQINSSLYDLYGEIGGFLNECVRNNVISEDEYIVLSEKRDELSRLQLAVNVLTMTRLVNDIKKELERLI